MATLKRWSKARKERHQQAQGKVVREHRRPAKRLSAVFSAPGEVLLSEAILEEILDRVRAALANVAIDGLLLTADRTGKISLDGSVRHDADRRTAEQAVAAVPRVKTIENRLEVGPAAGRGELPGDVLRPERASEFEPVEVELETTVSFNHDVGTTDSVEATEEAEPYFPPTDPPLRSAAREDEGFDVVGGFAETSLDEPHDPELAPRTTGDEELARLVCIALREDAGTTDLVVRVAVQAGVVHLAGKVTSIEDVELAEGVASGVPGVVDVEEDLEVEGV